MNLIGNLRLVLLSWMTMLFLILAPSPVQASYQVDRPIADGVINQYYLYGESTTSNGQTQHHRGVDFPDGVGTNLYAVTEGIVVGVRDGEDDNSQLPFGNYVMIRHTGLHWDRALNTHIYIYSIYAHLQINSINVDINDIVTKGTQIAGVGNTGNSSGAHLHLQIVSSEQSNQSNPENWGWSENESLNPEAWIEPFNHSGTQTATMIGRLSDSSGNKVGGKFITGAEKPSVAEHGNFVSALTYNFPWTNADPLIDENFATTDIEPGTYTIVARNTSATGSVYKQLGTYTFIANQTTYVGIDPVYLPDVRKNASNWTTKIYVRNNSTTESTKALITYYYSGGTVAAQTEYSIPSNGKTEIIPSTPNGFNGSATIMASNDISVATLYERDNPTAIDGYAGVEEPTSTVYIPILQKNNGGWYSDLYIQNSSNRNINVNVDFIAGTKGSNGSQSYSIEPWGFKKVKMATVSGIGSTFVGSAKITSSQPLAVSSTQFKGDGQLMATSNSQSTGTSLYAPLIQNDNGGYLSGITVLNASGAAPSVTVRYYEGNGSNCFTQSQSIGPEKNWIIYPAPSSPGNTNCGTVLSGRFTSQIIPLAANVNQLKGTTLATTYAAISQPSQTIYLPHIARNSTWKDGFVIRNTENSTANVTITFYNSDGTQNGNPLSTSINGNNYTIILNQVSTNLNGSARITSNRNIVVSVNNSRNGGSGDTLSSYPADHG